MDAGPTDGYGTFMPFQPQAPAAFIDRRAFLAGTGFVLGGVVARAATSGPTSLEARMLDTKPTFNGVVPGPTLRFRLGEPVTLRLANRLTDPLGLVFDGVRSAATVAGEIAAPGGDTVLRFTPSDAGTFQYRAVGPDAVAQTAGGLRGVLIVEEPRPPQVDADLLLAFGDDGVPGAGPLVNGRAPAMAITVAPGARVRLRLVNGCVNRVALVAVTGARPRVIAVDGQPSALFEPAAGAVPLGPGARFDLMLDAPGTAGAAVAAVIRGEAGHPDVPLLALATAGKPAAPHPPIAALPENPRLPARIALERALRQTVTIAPAPGGRWSVNGARGLDAPPLFTVKRGRPVVLTLENRSDVVQPFGIAGQCCRILHDLDDGWDPYWRNSLLLAPGKTKHVAFVPEEAGRWAMGSSDLVRRAAGLAASFEVR